MTKTLTRKRLDFFKPDPGNPRKSCTIEKLHELHDSLRKKQWIPLLAKPDGSIIDGWLRWSAAMLDGKPEWLDVIITDEPLTEAETREIQLVTAFYTTDLTPYEQFLGCRDWLALNAGSTAKELAATIDRDPSTIVRILSLSNCTPSIQQAAADSKLGPSEWYAISKVAQAEQEAMLTAKLAGASRDQLERQGRKLRNGDAPGIKVKKLKIPLASHGRSVTVAGSDLSLEDVIEILQETLKSARRAVGESLDGKTWVQVMKAKAGT